LPVRAVVLFLSLAPAALVGCGGSSSASGPDGTAGLSELGEPTDATGKAETTIDVVDNAYKPRVVNVSPGTKITFRNTGINVHNVTPNRDGDFNAVTLNPGQSATIVAPQAANAYRFFCTLHAGKESGLQRGALVVVAR
jgi:plastocyanin